MRVRGIQRCASPHLPYFVKYFRVNSPGWWADTVATYCPCRPLHFTKKNTIKYGERVRECATLYMADIIASSSFVRQDLYCHLERRGRVISMHTAKPYNFLIASRVPKASEATCTLWGIHPLSHVVLLCILSEVPVTNWAAG